MQHKELVLGCDNAAVGLMQEIRKYLDEQSIPYTYVGVDNEADETYYPRVAQKVAEEIIASGYQKEGLLICGTGIGMSITANKFRGSMPPCATITIPPSAPVLATMPMCSAWAHASSARSWPRKFWPNG
jgi:RpiB/LacA/LacB family sugar-phosphate isomerase